MKTKLYKHIIRRKFASRKPTAIFSKATDDAAAKKAAAEKEAEDKQAAENAEATPTENTTSSGEPDSSAINNLKSPEDFENMDPNLLKVQSDQSQKKIDTLPRDTVDEIIRQFAQKSETSGGLAMVGIAALCQAGGTNAGNPSLKRTINGKVFDISILRDVVSYVTNNKGTVRQLAKSVRNAIAAISIANDWQGPLANALVKEFPDMKFDSTELVYAAEYHDDNRSENFPKNIADALAIREARGREARRTQSKPGSKTKKQKKKK